MTANPGDLVVKKETEKRRCSYVELVADGPQIPDYCAMDLDRWAEGLISLLALPIF